jgi:hypothetical protein
MPAPEIQVFKDLEELSRAAVWSDGMVKGSRGQRFSDHGLLL